MHQQNFPLKLLLRLKSFQSLPTFRGNLTLCRCARWLWSSCWGVRRRRPRWAGGGRPARPRSSSRCSQTKATGRQSREHLRKKGLSITWLSVIFFLKRTSSENCCDAHETRVNLSLFILTRIPLVQLPVTPECLADDRVVRLLGDGGLATGVERAQIPSMGIDGNGFLADKNCEENTSIWLAYWLPLIEIGLIDYFLFS